MGNAFAARRQDRCTAMRKVKVFTLQNLPSSPLKAVHSLRWYVCHFDLVRQDHKAKMPVKAGNILQSDWEHFVNRFKG